MKKGDPYDFCDQFNEQSYEYEEGFPLNVIISLSSSGELLYEIKSPLFSVYLVFSLTSMK
jgi:ribosomal protein L11